MVYARSDVPKPDAKPPGETPTTPRGAEGRDTLESERATDPWSRPTLPPSDDPTSEMRFVPQPLSEPKIRDLGTGESSPSAPSRYVSRSLLGEGGMGVVRLVHDPIVGRDVAIKTIRKDRDTRPDIRARFLREARVQGRLEHPSIVPVYDMGTAADGSTYFTMRRVRGTTLGAILEGLANGDVATKEKYSRHRLLSAFGSVCLAVDFAHERGVVHRDLKPGNVMIGDFGEVYVLDWGVAKVDDSPDWVMPEETSGEHATVAGSYVGTLGYMAPEQLSGAEIDRRADVYALGALLFEILALEPLHVGTPSEMTATTLIGVDARCSERAPDRDVPEELEAICVRATAAKVDERFPSARAMYDALQRHLDRDLEAERRRELSAGYAQAALPRAGRALADDDPHNSEREQAMRDVGNALALDPKNRTALETMTKLLAHPPKEMPPEAAAALEKSRNELMRVTARMGAFVFGTWFLWLPLVVWMGVRAWAPLAVASLAFGASLVLCLVEARPTHVPNDRYSGAILFFACIGFAAMSRLFGSLVLLPTALFAAAVVYAQNYFRPIFSTVSFVFGAAVMIGPTALEHFGILAPSYTFDDAGMRIAPNVTSFPKGPTIVLLLVANVFVIASVWRLTRRIQRALADAEGRVAVHGWHLRLMVPEEARHAVRTPTVRGRGAKASVGAVPASRKLEPEKAEKGEPEKPRGT